MITETIQAIKTALEADAGLSGVPVVLLGFADDSDRIDGEIAGANGLCVGLFVADGDPAKGAEDAKNPVLTVTFRAEIFGNTTMQAGSGLPAVVPCCEKVVKALHKLTLPGQGVMQRPARLMLARGPRPVDDPDYLVYACEFEARVIL